ncbi:hypothetical protein RN51_00512 [Microbacterium oxydans]|uniref:Uncharacterized protein n=1 Tax=Microbacterium oxydans TaxID=82380 RepID=A0A0F0KXX1_9MICO|nr:hypothetical protein RN51_00512 [Microbacterium oxydans]
MAVTAEARTWAHAVPERVQAFSPVDADLSPTLRR